MKVQEQPVVGMVAGFFNPPHPGHEDNFGSAKEWLARLKRPYRLIAVTHSDDVTRWVKGNPAFTFEWRAWILTKLCGADEVRLSRSLDGTVVKDIETLRPAYFFKDGDRSPANMPKEELDVCARVGTEIVYLGNPKKAASSDMWADFRRQESQIVLK